jgi:hypothetical protein
MRINAVFSLFFINILLVITSGAYAQPQYVSWVQCYGGAGYDAFQSVKPTADGGFIAVGYTDSNDTLIKPRHAGAEVYVVKTDSNGNKQWYNTYGGSDDDFGYDIIQTVDGGYIFVGGTYSDDGDVIGNHGGEDVWVVKIDSGGTIQWQSCFGGTSADEAHAITQSTDGYYYIAGFTSSTDGDITQSFGDDDFWLLKIDISGLLVWEQSYGGSGNDDANAVAATPDSGCIMAGSSSSDNNGEVTRNHNSEDFWTVKVNSSGILQHENCYGSYFTDFATGVAVASDGNYVVCGSDNYTQGDASSGDVTVNYGGQDFWVIKLNDTLGLVWQQSYGGDSDDVANSIVSNADGSSYILGYTVSSDGDEIVGEHGKTDAWFIWIDSLGNFLEQPICIGDTGNDFGNSVCVAQGGDVIVGGTSNSNAGYLATNHGDYDGFITRLSNIPSSIYTPALHAEAVVYPNPTSDFLSVKLFNTTTIKSVQLQLLDVTGRTMFEQTGQSGSSYYYNHIDISSLPAGIYFLSLKINNTGYLVEKVVKD